MSIYNQNNKFISYLIILLSIFILILFTKNELLNIQENIDLKNTYMSDLDDKKSELVKINNTKKSLTNSSEDIEKYDVKIVENEIIDYIYSYIEETNIKNWVVLVKWLTISNPKDTEIWFKETNIDLKLVVPSEKKLKSIIDFLTWAKSKYNFFIKSFTYPYGKIEWNFSVNIPLKVLYK